MKSQMPFGFTLVELMVAIAIVLPNTALGQMLTQVADIDPSGDSFPDFMTVFDDNLYYRAFDGTADRLMRYSPSSGVEIADTINPRFLEVLDDQLYFNTDGNDGAGIELWGYDGTSNPPVRVADINGGPDSSDPVYMTRFGDHIYFCAVGGSEGLELWRFHGTEPAELVADISPFGDSAPIHYGVLGDELYFQASDGSNSGRELWKYNGTGDPQLAFDINQRGSGDSFPSYLTVFDGALYFAAIEGTTNSLWKYTGTGDPQIAANVSPSYLTVFADELYFAIDLGGSEELWKFNETDGARRALVNPPGGLSSLSHLAVFNEELYFQADTGDGTGVELWKITAPSLGIDYTWDIEGGGDWNNSSNWTLGEPPNGTNHNAVFGNRITSPSTVTNNTTISVREIRFDNANSYTLSGNGIVNLEAGTPPAIVAAVQGTHQFDLPVNALGATNIIVESGALLDFDGRLNLAGGTLTKMGDGTMNVNFPTNPVDGTVVVDAGTFGGEGTVPGDVELNGGKLAPGNSTGTLTVGNYIQGAAGTLEIEIAGTTPGGEHDQLVVDGMATLAGTLEVIALSGLPTIKTHTLTVLTATNGVAGEFSSIPDIVPAANGQGVGHLGSGLYFQGVNVNASDVTINLFQALAGDTDGDSDIDITDFNALATNFDPIGGNSATNDWPTADFDGDGDVDITDFSFISSNFAPTGYGAGPALNDIPEPTSFLLLVLGVAIAGWYRYNCHG